MNRGWQIDREVHEQWVAVSVPPPMVEETGWDILIALYSDRRGEVSTERLASMASVPQTVLDQWLARLNRRRLIAGVADGFTGEVRAVLTSAGRELIDTYLWSTRDLQVLAHR